MSDNMGQVRVFKEACWPCEGGWKHVRGGFPQAEEKQGHKGVKVSRG